jgi:type II secretory pathway component PulF
LKSFGVLEPWYRLLLKEPAGVLGMVSKFYYPLSIALASMLLFYFLAVSIVPTFKAMFDDFELRLPSLTKWFLQTSDFIAYQPVSLLASLFSGILAVYGLVKLYSYLMDRFEGSSFISFYRRGTKRSLGSMARWTGTMAELLAIGAPAAQAVATAGIASQRPYLNLQSQRLSKTFEANPKSTWRAQGGSTSFAGSSIAALEMHQQGTDTTGVLRELAQSYAERWNCRANLSYDWLGPIILLFVAKFVFFLVLALFLPLISLITSLSG